MCFIQAVCATMGNIFFWCQQGREATGRQGRLGVSVVQAELWLTPLLKECVRICSMPGKGLEFFCLFSHVEMIPSSWCGRGIGNSMGQERLNARLTTGEKRPWWCWAKQMHCFLSPGIVR